MGVLLWYEIGRLIYISPKQIIIIIIILNIRGRRKKKNVRKFSAKNNKIC